MQKLSVVEIEQIAHKFFESKYFRNVQTPEQAFVIIQTGQEVGIPPSAAMRGIELVDGQISYRAHMLAALIKQSGKYDYCVITSSDTVCKIDFQQGGNVLGTSVFSLDDAKQAGLANRKAYSQFPSAMLYNRAMSQGARMFCPDILLGAGYVEGEIGGEDYDREPETPTPLTDSVNSFITADEDDIPPIVVPEVEPVEAVIERIFDGVTQDTLRGETGVIECTEEDIQPVFRMEDIEITDASAPEPPSPKQLAFLVTLLTERGVRDNDVQELMLAVVPTEHWNVHHFSDVITKVKSKEQLQAEWINAYVLTLRTERGLSKDHMTKMLKGYFEVKSPHNLNRIKQIELINMICENEIVTSAELSEIKDF